MRAGGFGPLRALIDPCAEQADLRGGETLAFRRHHHVLDEAGDVVNERTARAVAGDDRDAVRVAAGEGGGFAVHAVGVLVFLRTVATEAVLIEQRANFRGEIDGAREGRRKFRRVDRGCGGCGRRGKRGAECAAAKRGEKQQAVGETRAHENQARPSAWCVRGAITELRWRARGEDSPNDGSRFEPQNREQSAGYQHGALLRPENRAVLEAGAPVHGMVRASSRRLLQGVG